MRLVCSAETKSDDLFVEGELCEADALQARVMIGDLNINKVGEERRGEERRGEERRGEERRGEERRGEERRGEERRGEEGRGGEGRGGEGRGGEVRQLVICFVLYLKSNSIFLLLYITHHYLSLFVRMMKMLKLLYSQEKKRFLVTTKYQQYINTLYNYINLIIDSYTISIDCSNSFDLSSDFRF